MMSTYASLWRWRRVRAGRIALVVLACLLAADIHAALAQAAPSPETTVFTIIVTRHGVRATSRARTDPAGYRPTDWSPVGNDDLTAHGYRLMRLMGEFYRDAQAKKGLPVDCDAKTAYVYADVAQRTLGTAHALIEGLCATPGKPDKLAVFHAADSNEKDPIFDATKRVEGNIEGAKSRNAVDQAAAPIETIVKRHVAKFAAFQKLLDPRCDLPHCDPVSAGDSTIKPPPAVPDNKLAALDGPIAHASGFAEDVFLEFAECREEGDIAKLDGQALRSDLDAGMRLHVVAYDVNARNISDPPKPGARNVYNPLPRGGTLFTHIAAMLYKKAGRKALDYIAMPPELDHATLVVFSGHDTQLGALGGILDAHWTPEKGIVSDDMPPGSALIFDLVKRPANPPQDQYAVRLRFASLGREDFRHEMPVKENAITNVTCRQGECVMELDRFEQLVTALKGLNFVVDTEQWNASFERLPQDAKSFADPKWMTDLKCAGVHRDWKTYPAIIQLDTSQDVYAIGDPHGDWERLAKVLGAAKLIDKNAALSAPDQVKWTGEGAVLVITGDMIDKGPDSLGVIALVRALRSDAAARGGRVIITMGNHEAEFLAKRGHNEFVNELIKAKLDPEEVADCAGDIGQFLCTLPIAVRVNDWFFSHAGNTNGRTIDDLVKAIEASARDGFDSPELGGTNSDNSILEARLNEQGPCEKPWIQDGCSTTPEKLLLPGYIKTLGVVNHLVQGHQPGKVTFPDNDKIVRQKGHFYQRWGLLFLIDAGMSRDIKESGGGALKITRACGVEQAIVICPDNKGGTAVLWNKDITDYAEKYCPR